MAGARRKKKSHKQQKQTHHHRQESRTANANIQSLDNSADVEHLDDGNHSSSDELQPGHAESQLDELIAIDSIYQRGVRIIKQRGRLHLLPEASQLLQGIQTLDVHNERTYEGSEIQFNWDCEEVSAVYLRY